MLTAGREWSVSPSGVRAWSRFMPGLHRRLDRPPLSDLTKVRRLGVLRPDGIGDMVLTTGMLRELVIGVAEGARPGTRGDGTQTGPYDTLSIVVRPPAGRSSDTELDTALVRSEAVAAATLELL